MFIEYIYIFKYLIFCLFISFLLFSISFFLVIQKPEIEKLSAYECGFNPFGDARNKFEVRFYLIGILFIIFDLEIIYLFPWVVSLMHTSINGIIFMILFLIILTIGFIFEWFYGALNLE